MTDYFDFTNSTDSSIVIRSTLGVAIFKNENGDVVIRQDGWLNDEDSYIVVSRSDAELLGHALMAEANRDA